MRVDTFLDQGLRTFLAQYLKNYPEPDERCGHKGQKTTFDVNFIAQKLIASNLRLRLDDAQALLPAFTPVLASVGSVSVQFSLSLNRPLKACINDVFMLLRADPRTSQEHSPEELREVIHSWVLTYCLLRGELVADDDGIHHPTSSDIGLKPEAIDKLEQLVQQSEIWVERLHIRVEDSGVSASPPLNLPEEPGKGFAAGLTLDSIRLQGDDFHSMTKFMDEVRLIGAPDPPPLPSGIMEEVCGSSSLCTPQPPPNSSEQRKATRLRVCKVGVLKGIKIYCYGASNNDIYSHKSDGKGVPSDSELQRLMGEIFSPSCTFPMEEHPLLQLDTATLCVGLSLSREVLGLITSAYIHIVLSPLHMNLSTTLLGRILRWIALKNRHSEALLYACTRPVVEGIRRHVTCLWKQAVRTVLRQVRIRFTMGSTATTEEASVKKRRREMKEDNNNDDLSHGVRNISTRRALSRKWRWCFEQWLEAARYIRIRELLHGHTELESAPDATSGHQHRIRYGEVLNSGNGQIIRATILPWMIPKPDLTASEALLHKLMRRRESIRTEKSCKIWRSLSAERNLERGNKRIENIHEMEAAKEEDEHGQPNNMVDRVGTLLLCPVQATGLKALAHQVPLTVGVKLTLEEANAAPEEFEYAKVNLSATYDSRSKSYQWVNKNGGKVIDFHVELGEEQARHLEETSQKNGISLHQRAGAATRFLVLRPSDCEGRSTKKESGDKSSSLNQDDGEPPLNHQDSFPSSFLLIITITAKARVLGNIIDLGSGTLPGGILTAKRGRVCEHRCSLIGKRQSREGLAVLSDHAELLLLSTFVPPGDDVTKEEHYLRLAFHRITGTWGISDPTTAAMFSESGGSESRVLDTSDLLTDAAHGVKTVGQIAKECDAPLWVSVLPQKLFISSHISQVTVSNWAIPRVQMRRAEVKKNNFTSSSCGVGIVGLQSVPLLDLNARLIQGVMEMDLRSEGFGRLSLQTSNISITDYQAPVLHQSLLHLGPLKASIEAIAKSWYTPPGGYAFLHMDNWNADNVITSITSGLWAYSINWSPQSIESACHHVWRSAGSGHVANVSQSCLVGSSGQTGDAWITVQGFDWREVSASVSFGKFNIAMGGGGHCPQQPRPQVENEEQLRQRIKELERQLMVMRTAPTSVATNDGRGGE